MKKFTKYELEQLAEKVIAFLQKWGLWEGTSIFTNGNRYMAQRGSSYKDLRNVVFTENVAPEDYLSAYTMDCKGELTEDGRDSYANPEHIFDMTFEGPLHTLLNEDEYVVPVDDVQPEAWEYLFRHSEILDDYLMQRYGWCSEEEFAEEYYTGKENPNWQGWDPTEFDTWEEYLDFVNGDFCEDDAEVACRVKSGSPEESAIRLCSLHELWERVREQSKLDFIAEHRGDPDLMIEVDGIAPMIREELREIFRAHGLWVDMGFAWSLSCFRNGKQNCNIGAFFE